MVQTISIGGISFDLKRPIEVELAMFHVESSHCHKRCIGGGARGKFICCNSPGV